MTRIAGLRRNRIVIASLVSVTALAVTLSAWSQVAIRPGEMAIDAASRERTIARIADLLNERYVFPKVAARCASRLDAQLRSGAYEQHADAMSFAEALTRDLQAETRDKHLRVRPRPPGAASLDSESAESTPDERRSRRDAMRDQMRKDNFGFQRLERLEGNVGYLNLLGFVPAELGGEAAAAAMAFLANADAVIIDLRHNGGGSPSMIQYISTYFFDEPTLLNTMYWREGDRTDQFWTLPHVPGRRMPDTPLFILTSAGTFSGAEEFAYNMKNLERGTIVGETTGGGAHPGDSVPVNDQFAMFIPTGRAINPISKTNWEGVGVEPDITVPAEKALAVAHAKAVEALENAAKSPEDRARLAWARASLEAALSGITLGEAELQRCVGAYGERRIWLRDGRLMYQRHGMPERALRPMAHNLFAVEGVPFFRVRFEFDQSGRAARLVGLYDDGREEPMERSGD